MVRGASIPFPSLLPTPSLFSLLHTDLNSLDFVGMDFCRIYGYPYFTNFKPKWNAQFYMIIRCWKTMRVYTKLLISTINENGSRSPLLSPLLFTHSPRSSFKWPLNSGYQKTKGSGSSWCEELWIIFLLVLWGG